MARRNLVWVFVALALALAVGSAVAEGGFRRYFKLSNEVRELKERNERQATENARLRREADALKNDDRAIERAAREDLGFVKPQEVVISLEKK